MVDIFLFIALFATVIIAVFEKKKRDKEIDKLIKNQEQSTKDIQAIADAINVYSSSIKGNVQEQVKGNMDLFNEWLTGEEE